MNRRVDNNTHAHMFAPTSEYDDRRTRVAVALGWGMRRAVIPFDTRLAAMLPAARRREWGPTTTGAFTSRERQILCLIASDRSDKQIAIVLGMSRHTLRTHIDRMFRRHGLHSRAAAVAVWLCHGYGLDVPTFQAG